MRERETGRSFGGAVGWTLLGSILPGLGLWRAGRRTLGTVILAVTVVLFGVGGWLVVAERDDLLRGAVHSTTLQIASAVLVAFGLCWVAVIVASYRALRPQPLSGPQRVGGSVMVAVLAAVVVFPLATGSWLLTVQQDLVDSVFESSDQIRSETKPKNVTPEDPWGGRDRLNVLVLGSDGGKGRTDEFGERTDTVMVASIDVHTGDTTLFGLPRNLLRIPFPEDSKLAEIYPRGFGPERDFISEDEQLTYMLTSIYHVVPEENPGLLQSDNPGADAVKLGVGEALGLDIDYYVAVNLSGFEELIDALGGITVNINYPVPIGGETGVREPDGYLEPGPNQTLQGKNALWFARGRYGLDDYKRMERQRCVVDAVIDQAEPVNILRRYQGLASASKKMVRTDIPDSLLGPLMDLSGKVQQAEFDSIILDEDDAGIVPHDVDYDRMRAIVQAGVDGAEDPTDPTGDGTDGADGAETPHPGDPNNPDNPDDSDGSDDSDDSEDSGNGDTGDSSDAGEQDTEQETDPCAYNPEH